MQKIFDEVGSLDQKCYEQFFLSEDILMEHAANNIATFIKDKFKPSSSILIVCGVGNNGADGIALARLLAKQFFITLMIPFGVKSPMAHLQLQRVQSIGIATCTQFDLDNNHFDVVVDAIFGTGLKRELDQQTLTLLTKLNTLSAYKIACDIPTGININGDVEQIAFKADTTITMGALKKSLYNDNAKDYVGDIIVANLGVARELYEKESDTFLLELSDLKLPLRKTKNTNKGDFGHLNVIVGEKVGAGLLCAEAGFAFGAGLVSIITQQKFPLKYHIMQNNTLTKNATALAFGMGLGEGYIKDIKPYLDNNIPKVIDADFLYQQELLTILEQNNIILTPHPKEFCALLQLTKIADISIAKLQSNRFFYLQKWANKYPNVTLILKGANTIITQNNKFFVNPYGSNILSFGGSGDVLAGLVASLLAQGYTPLQAAINGSLAHTIAAKNFTKNNYAMTPQDLIEEVKKI